MRKFLFIFVLVVSMGMVAMPAGAKTPGAGEKSSLNNVSGNQTRTRYVRLRGKRYRVTYRLFKRGGRWYYRIVSARRA